MATSEQTLYIALLFLVFHAASCSQVYSHYTPVDRVSSSDNFDHFLHGLPHGNEPLWSVSQADFQLSLTSSDTIHTMLISMPGRLHCPPWPHVSQIKPVWLWLVSGCTTPHYCGVLNKLRLSRNRTPYYNNTTASFNITLAGDIEVNPGPESSGVSTVHTKKPTSDTSLQIYLQNVRSLKNKLDVLHSSLVAHLQPGGVFNFFALTETWL